MDALNEVPLALRDIFSRVLQIPTDEITLEASTKTTKNWDSLRHVELVVEVEEKFGVSFAATEVFELTTVKGFCEMLAKKRAGEVRV